MNEYDKLNPVVHFYHNAKGELIGRNNDGRIAFIDRHSTVDIEPGSDWRCVITISNDKTVVVKPINIIFTKKENEELLLNAVKSLQEKYSKV